MHDVSKQNFDLRKRSYLLNRLSERSGSAAKRKEIKSLVGIAML
jgi:hypothetical protein